MISPAKITVMVVELTRGIVCLDLLVRNTTAGHIRKTTVCGI
jgi:hypothetical protein